MQANGLILIGATFVVAGIVGLINEDPKAVVILGLGAGAIALGAWLRARWSR